MEDEQKEVIRSRIISATQSFDGWFRAWKIKNKLEIDVDGLFTIGKNEIRFDVLRSRLFIEAKEDGKRFTYIDIDAHFSVLFDRLRNEHIQAICKQINVVEVNDTCEQFIRAITGKQKDIDVASLKHFVWQVKRKLMGLSVEHHMMIVLCGHSGSGKSVAIRKLIGPLEKLYAEKQLDCVADERQYQAFEDRYIILFDEMAREQKADVNALKRIITSDRITFRPLFTNLQKTIRNKSTMIGTSNQEIRDLVKDHLSSRRWYQIDSQELCDWEVINKMDYIALWRSVDANQASPIVKHLESVKQWQQETKYLSPVEQFIEEIDLKKSKDFKVPSICLFKKFVEWSKDNCEYTVSSIDFYRRLRAIGYESCGILRYKNQRVRGIFGHAEGLEMIPVIN